jgi:hypothetical protein
MGFNPFQCDMALSHYSSAIETEKARLLGLAKACQQLGIPSNGFDLLNQMAIFDEVYGKVEAHSLPVTQQDPRIRQEALTALSAILRKAIEVYNAEGNGTTISLDRFELKTNKKTNLMTLEFAYSVHLVPNTE